MTADEAVIIIQTAGLVLLYAITGIGPGLVVGVWLGNLLGAPGRETLVQKHLTAMKRAGEHNAQWNPQDPRWQK